LRYLRWWSAYTPRPLSLAGAIGLPQASSPVRVTRIATHPAR